MHRLVPGARLLSTTSVSARRRPALPIRTTAPLLLPASMARLGRTTPAGLRFLASAATESSDAAPVQGQRIGHPLSIPPAPPSADAIHVSSSTPFSQPTQPRPPALAPSGGPDPWLATRTTLQAFWSRYGNYVHAYLVWSIVGSLALNVLWTRQEREEVEDAALVKIRKLERELTAVEAEVSSKASKGEKEKEKEKKVEGEGKGASRVTWYLPWTWSSSSSPSSSAGSVVVTVEQVRPVEATVSPLPTSTASKSSAPVELEAPPVAESEPSFFSQAASVRRPRPAQVTLY